MWPLPSLQVSPGPHGTPLPAGAPWAILLPLPPLPARGPQTQTPPPPHARGPWTTCTSGLSGPLEALAGGRDVSLRYSTAQSSGHQALPIAGGAQLGICSLPQIHPHRRPKVAVTGKALGSRPRGAGRGAAPSPLTRPGACPALSQLRNRPRRLSRQRRGGRDAAQTWRTPAWDSPPPPGPHRELRSATHPPVSVPTGARRSGRALAGSPRRPPGLCCREAGLSPAQRPRAPRTDQGGSGTRCPLSRSPRSVGAPTCSRCEKTPSFVSAAAWSSAKARGGVPSRGASRGGAGSVSCVGGLSFL